MSFSIFGKYTKTLIGSAKDSSIRLSGSSGGVVTSVLVNALSKGLINSVIVVGMNEKERWKPEFKICKTKKEILESTGSKYTLMNIKDLLDKIKSSNGNVAVVCLPCQLRIIRNLQRSGKIKNVKYLIGLFCGYNMSFNATEFLLKKLRIKKEAIKELRYRGGKYPGGFYVKLKNDKIIKLSKNYYDILNLMFVPEGCLNCKDYMNELADISAGDAWGYKNRSLIITRNEKGEELLNNGDVDHFEIDESEVFDMHRHNIKHKKNGDKFLFSLVRVFLRKFGKFIPIRTSIFLSNVRRELYKIKTPFRRAIKEYKYVTKNWDYRSVGRFWNTVQDYDEIDDETYAYKRRFYDSIKMCSFPEKSHILDIDCRTGNGTVFYHRNGKVQSSVCVSPSESFLKICKERLEKYNVRAKTLLLRRLPLLLKDESFDAVLCLETIEHIPPSKRLEFLREVNRLLKKEGELILSMPNLLWEPVHWLVAVFGIHHSEGPHRFLRLKKIKKLLKESGFKIEKLKTTVIIPIGPRWFTRFGEKLEKVLGEKLMNLIGLRHIFICKK